MKNRSIGESRKQQNHGDNDDLRALVLEQNKFCMNVNLNPYVIFSRGRHND